MPASNASPVDALAVSRRILKILVVLNYAMGAGIACLLVASLVAPGFTMAALGLPIAAGSSGLVLQARLIMVIGILAVALSAVVLRYLLAIVDTVRRGDPFVSENAARLEGIAWSILGLEVLHMIIGIVVSGAIISGRPINIGWSLWDTRWLSIPLLFVLAKVFAHGARMRDDLAGTV